MLHHFPTPSCTHDMKVSPLTTKGNMQGLPVSGPDTVWQLEQGDSVQMSPQRWRFSSWEQEPLQGFHVSIQSSLHQYRPRSCVQRSRRLMVGVQSSLQKPTLPWLRPGAPELSTWVLHHLSPAGFVTHERWVSPSNKNGKTQGLPVSGPLTVWQLEQGDSVQMSPHKLSLSEHDPSHGFHFSIQSSPHM